MSGPATYGARARIKLGAIRHNLATLSEKAPGARCMAVIKANAYGHGLQEVARVLDRADCLAVARLSEAARLRDAGIDTDIVVMGGPLAADDLSHAADLRCGIAIHDSAQASWVETFSGRLPAIWIKVDTGMRRLGIYADQVPGVFERVAAAADVLGLMTHFANADDTNDDTTLRQFERFALLVADFEGQVSIANSATLLSWQRVQDALADVANEGRLWIRPGLALYGLSPFPGRTGKALGLRPAMQLESRLLSVKPVRQGDRVGYGGDWRAAEDSTLGIVAAGYGDGYSRQVPSGTPVLVNGRRVPVAGRVSMDLTAVDLGPGATDAVGDPVVLWGDDLPVEEIAESAGTIPYTLVTGVTHREPAFYED